MTAAEAIQDATTGMGVVDYARLAARLTRERASPELWRAVADLLSARGEAQAWERYLGLEYPLEQPTVLSED